MTRGAHSTPGRPRRYASLRRLTRASLRGLTRVSLRGLTRAGSGLRGVTRAGLREYAGLRGPARAGLIAAMGAVAVALAVTAALGGFQESGAGRAAPGRSVPPGQAFVARPAARAALPPGGLVAALGPRSPRRNAPAPTGPAAIPPITVQVVSSPGIGQVLATSDGTLLYRKTTTVHGSLACTGTCASQWRPLLLAPGQALQAPPSLPGQLGTITRPDGRLQVAYNGAPLFQYVGGGAGPAGHWQLARVRR